MKGKKRESRPKPAPPPAGTPGKWLYGLGLFAALYVAFQAYSPVLHGPFLFDDEYLPFRVPNFPDTLRAWIVGVRPVLMLSYWMNFRLSGEQTFSYHVVNVLLHAANGFLIYWIVRKFLELAGVEASRRGLPALFAAGLFLLHPAQTESVAYVASRSETLSVFFVLAAITVFLYRRTAGIGWGSAAAILALFVAALGSKEHTAVLALALLLIDFCFNPGFSFKGIRRNWRLHVPLALGMLAGVAFVLKSLLHADTAGFRVKDFTWYQYFFTQCRALFVYLRLLVLPVGQTVDYDFPISRTLLEHGAIAGMVALLALTVAAWVWRRRFPLASCGWFLFLIFMAPTSSIVPIQDPVAERRMYLPFLGLLLIVTEGVLRVRAERRALAAGLAAVLLVFGIASYRRNQVWSDSLALWRDTVEKSPRKPRPRFQLAYAYYEQGRCAEALPHYEAVSRLQPPAYDLYIDWALAYDCLSQMDPALDKLRRAAALERSAHAYSMIGMVYAKNRRWSEALQALDIAQKIDPGYAMTYAYRGGVYLSQRQYEPAVREYSRALAINPRNQAALEGLPAAQAGLRAAH